MHAYIQARAPALLRPSAETMEKFIQLECKFPSEAAAVEGLTPLASLRGVFKHLQMLEFAAAAVSFCCAHICLVARSNTLRFTRGDVFTM